ncbi:MAG: hypothetical protein R3F62_21430 [Planctomycetota bacterium]
MPHPKRASDYLTLGDALLRRGWVCLAASAYARAVDVTLGESLLARARDEVRSVPQAALATLRRVEELVGPSREGRALLAQAYGALGHPELAASFAAAAQSD